MSKIRLVNDIMANYPEVENAGILGDIVNKRWADEWVSSNTPHFKPFGDMAIDVLIEEYNERHKSPTE